tara:strand:+ start:10086 stop:10268 length:183 start_codon:yes stop_codon:yes gene_type:complete
MKNDNRLTQVQVQKIRQIMPNYLIKNNMNSYDEFFNTKITLDNEANKFLKIKALGSNEIP